MTAWETVIPEALAVPLAVGYVARHLGLFAPRRVLVINHAAHVRELEHECEIRDAAGDLVVHTGYQCCERRDWMADEAQRIRQQAKDELALKRRAKSRTAVRDLGPRVRPPWETGASWSAVDDAGRQYGRTVQRAALASGQSFEDATAALDALIAKHLAAGITISSREVRPQIPLDVRPPTMDEGFR